MCYYFPEVLGAVISILMIWMVTGVLVYMAVERVCSMDFEINPFVMLITSGVGVAVNIMYDLFCLHHLLSLFYSSYRIIMNLSIRGYYQ